MPVGIERSILTGLGPLQCALVPSNTVPATGACILNGTVGTTSTKVISGNVPDKIRRLKIVGVTPGVNLAWAAVAIGAADPAIKADGDGSADEGSILVGGGTEWVTVMGWMDIYLVAGAASTAYQITIVEA